MLENMVQELLGLEDAVAQEESSPHRLLYLVAEECQVTTLSFLVTVV